MCACRRILTRWVCVLRLMGRIMASRPSRRSRVCVISLLSLFVQSLNSHSLFNLLILLLCSISQFSFFAAFRYSHSLSKTARNISSLYSHSLNNERTCGARPAGILKGAATTRLFPLHWFCFDFFQKTKIGTIIEECYAFCRTCWPWGVVLTS